MAGVTRHISNFLQLATRGEQLARLGALADITVEAPRR